MSEVFPATGFEGLSDFGLYPDEPGPLALQRAGERDAFTLAPSGPPTPPDAPLPQRTTWEKFWDTVYGVAPQVWDPVLDATTSLGSTAGQAKRTVEGLLAGLESFGRNLVPLAYLGLGAAALYLVVRLRGR